VSPKVIKVVRVSSASRKGHGALTVAVFDDGETISFTGRNDVGPIKRQAQAARDVSGDAALDKGSPKEQKSEPSQTYSGADIARMHDALRNRWKATIKGLRVELKNIPGRGPYDRWDLYINEQKVWSTESTNVPVSAGGSVEAFVVHALQQAGIKRESY
jgi:hypothetical protein